MIKKTTKYTVQLSDEEKTQLLHLISQGKPSARTVTRARILLKAHEKWNDEQIAKALEVSTATVSRTRQKYVEAGMARALNNLPHAARPQKFTGSQQATIIATACSQAPDGHDHWTIRLLADKVVELGLADKVAPETVRAVLKKTHLNPGRKSNGACPPSEQIS